MKINSFNKIHNNYEVMYNNIIENWEIYLYENPKIESMIIGISGGIDSAIVAVLARQVIDKMNREIKLIGYSLPLISNQEDETNLMKNRFLMEYTIKKNYQWLTRYE